MVDAAESEERDDPPAQEAAAEVEGVWRRPTGAMGVVIPVIAVAWSLFQLAVASFWTLDSLQVRAVHLAFALLLIFLARPCFRPDLIARWLGMPHEQRYWTAPIGLALFFGVYIWQRLRSR